MLIKLRDDLFQGKTFEIGGRDLVGMDNALSSLSSALGALGAQGQRLEITQARLETEAHNIASIDSLSSDLDTTKAIMDLKMLEHTHRAALSVAARILQPTLLDFLR
jgi:flagellar hook-associated protein 3 FlgL